MTSQMLILFAVFVDHAKMAQTLKEKQSENAMASFTFFLFLNYGIFGTLLYAFRDSIYQNIDFQADSTSDPESHPPEGN